MVALLTGSLPSRLFRGALLHLTDRQKQSWRLVYLPMRPAASCPPWSNKSWSGGVGLAFYLDEEAPFEELARASPGKVTTDIIQRTV